MAWRTRTRSGAEPTGGKRIAVKLRRRRVQTAWIVERATGETENAAARIDQADLAAGWC
jgi:hypothetical protein